MVGKNLKKSTTMRYTFLMLFCALLLHACSEEPIGQTPTDKIPPGPITNPSVENTPGGAIITYTLPDDEDLLYVKAVYELTGGVIAETKSSVYLDTLSILGFGDTKEREVTLIAVDRSENESKPVQVKVQPLTPPVYSVFETLTMVEDFGGVRYTWSNPTSANLEIALMQKIDNEYKAIETLYTSRKEGNQATRGLKSKEAEFGICIRDRWSNVSDTLFRTLTPIFEMQIPLENIRPFVMAGDTNTEYGWVTENMWDGDLMTGWHTETYTGPWPHRFTFTVTTGAVKLSRFKVYQRNEWNQWLYRHGNPKKFELYGSNEPNKDGSLDGWTLIDKYESYKPSGLPLGELTNEDIEYIQNGEEFPVDISVPAFKYFRVYVTESWVGSHFAHIIEFPLWGSIEGYIPDEDEEE